MKAFVLIADFEYDGSCLMGVYSSMELAEKAFQNYKRGRENYMKIKIQEREIDEEAYIQW